MIYVAVKETGEFITRTLSIKEGFQIIHDFEEEDRNYNNYTPNYYDIVDENHVSILK